MNHAAQVLSIEVGFLKKLTGGESLLPPWLFRQQDLLNALENAQHIEQQDLINKLNYIHFMGDSVFVYLRHPKYEDGVLVRANPEPCLGREVICRWSDGNLSGLKLESYSFQYVIIADGQSIILVPAELKNLDGETLRIDLPETGFAVGQRKARRYLCQGVAAELIQSGFLATGDLVDFSPLGFRIRVNPGPSSSFNWFNPDQQVSINLYQDKRIIYSDFCRVIRQTEDHVEREIVLAPVTERIRRFKKKEIRNARHRLVPSPTISFNHPFFRKRIQREVHDISTSGFSVIEEESEGVLLTGLLLADLTINYASILKMTCTAQVLYRRPEKENKVLCGLAILDMDIKDYSRLSHILSSASDPYVCVSSEVDMDALWEFFFDTGFIYPKKYHLFQSYRDDFKETYRKLYQENPEIARHFTYEKDGKIYGHMSMVRAYERTWMIHHHAARPLDGKRTGFVVLKHLVNYLNGMYHLPSASMDYLMCYFRPDNTFPNLIFGDFSRELGNSKGCSMDLFSYVPYPVMGRHENLPDEWALKESSALELWELDLFYRHVSGGLFFEAFGIRQNNTGESSLSMTCSRLGFTRHWMAYSLVHRGDLKAVLIVDQSDLGINLSELLNCIKIVITDPGGLPWQILSTAIDQLAGIYQVDKIPILIYPTSYAEAGNVLSEKQYNLWILDVHFGNEYLAYMQKKFGAKFR